MEHLENPTANDLERWVKDVENAAKSGNLPQAIGWSERALALGFEHARLLQFRALGHERAGQTSDAVADLRQAHRLDPADPGVANALGSNLTRAGRLNEAASVLGAEAQARPQIPETWFNLASAQMAAGNLSSARTHFEQAIALRPDFAPALGRLAVLATHRGDVSAGLLLAERTLRLDPANADARRAAIEAAMAEKRALDAELAAIEWSELPGLGPNARSHALGLLGDALDLQGRTSEAFGAYSASKDAFRQAHSRRFRALEQQSLAATLGAMEREFSRLPTERWADRGIVEATAEGPRAHVFLMGFMRSGTTLLEQALSRHPDVVSMEETEALAEAGAGLLSQPGGLTRIAEANTATLDHWRSAYWTAVEQAGVSYRGKVFMDKLPFNGVKLALIARLFPDARILFAIRDPRDVVLSCFQKRLQPNGFAYEMRTLDGAARLYAAYMSLVRTYRASLPLSILDHRHEALLQDFRGAVEDVCEFIGLDFRSEMANFHTSAGEGGVMSQTSRQLREGLTTKGLGRWRTYVSEMAEVGPILAPWVKAYGYDE